MMENERLRQLAPNSYFQNVDAIKLKNNLPYCNILANATELADIIGKKPGVKLFSYMDTAILLLIPMHDMYFDLYFHAKSLEDLDYSLKLFSDFKNKINIPIIVTLIDKKEKIDCINQKFINNSFNYLKRLQRTKSNKGMSILRNNICKSFRNDLYNHVRFAKREDAENIYIFMNKIFDIYKDNIPEIDDIKKAASRNEIIIIDIDDKIISLHYFTIKNHIYQGLFDATSKEYRNQFAFFNIINYFHDYLKDNGIIVRKAYGWRDLDNKRLLRHARNMDQPMDDVFLYKLIANPASMRND